MAKALLILIFTTNTDRESGASRKKNFFNLTKEKYFSLKKL
jgi:hypothetical protein